MMKLNKYVYSNEKREITVGDMVKTEDSEICEVLKVTEKRVTLSHWSFDRKRSFNKTNVWLMMLNPYRKH